MIEKIRLNRPLADYPERVIQQRKTLIASYSRAKRHWLDQDKVFSAKAEKVMKLEDQILRLRKQIEALESKQKSEIKALKADKGIHILAKKRLVKSENDLVEFERKVNEGEY